MWQTQLLVLGLVGWLQPVHGYDVQRELLSWGVTDWGRVKRGSIYHALKRLSADGYLEVVTTEQVSNRPERTTYKITQKGGLHFQSMLRDRLWDTTLTFDQFWVPWSFIAALSHREATAVLRNRAQSLRANNATQTEELSRRSSDRTDPMFIPEHVVRAIQLQGAQHRLEAQWCLDVADEIEAGKIYTETEPYLLGTVSEQWKAHIRQLDADGRIPPTN
ncbi:PadR family transcriptional regulator [Stackebrandtia soli]|uniref:PadR family transcriptional regulator n=1 Tax=Stackebrandtia soli TaxID=1892856 RepID=UPI0039E8D518